MPFCYLLNCSSFAVKSLKLSTFSNLPYTTHKTNTIHTDLKTNPKPLINLGRFRFRKTIVSLRAPKHFKIGRQHYSLGSRFSYFFFKNKHIKWVSASNPLSIVFIVTEIYNLPSIWLKQPLTTLKTVNLNISIKFKITTLD